MATSRTGTASHKRFRREVLRAGQRAGITHCPMPGCGVQLDYEVSRQPNSAEPDHLVPWANGGRNTADNGRVICRQCNQKRGNGKSRREAKREATQARHVTTLVQW